MWQGQKKEQQRNLQWNKRPSATPAEGGGEQVPSKIDLFLLYHIAQAIEKNNSKSWRDL